ncbi:MAG: sensor histidine kinase [Ignavibacteria bacterium]|nr:sensor histidine kinase [Ignavibacteria bacterium]
MGKKSGYVWILFLLLLVLVIDAYYQIESSPVPIWQTQWFLWRISALILIFAGAILYNYYQSSKKRKKELEVFKDKLIEKQESEWKVIAGELHDSIGQNLSAINIFLQQEMKSMPEPSQKVIEASSLVVETVDEVRRISQRLYPKQIERLGLTVSIEAMIERIASISGIKFNCNIDKIDSLLSHENEVQYFRVIQEIVNNIMKHSGAKNVSFIVRKSVMFIITEIDDDGVGFETKNHVKLGFGLINIEERLRMMKAVYEFTSEKGKGTKFKITVPIK